MMQRTLGWIALVVTSIASNVEGQDTKSAVRGFIERYAADVQTLNHRFRVPLDSAAMERKLAVTNDWLVQLREQNFGKLDRVSKIDYLLLRSELEYQLQKLKRDSERDKSAAELLPYATELIAFCKSREDVDAIKPNAVAELLDAANKKVEIEVRSLQPMAASDTSDEATQRRLRALRSSELVSAIRNSLREAHSFYNTYDPQYSWWAKQPMDQLLASLEKHRVALRERVVGVPDTDQETIIGLPIGDEGLKLELEHEWIAHTPAELITVADREMKWCDEQMLVASRELGFGDDWRKALEHVKSKHVEPGAQPEMIRNLAWEAIRFLEANDLVTVPPLAAQGWRMTMMSPERQRVNPYFLGGETIIVSFPTDSMTHEEKLMSMRSNNEHFSRATVHHELIPGHHLQYHMLPRYRPYRTLFNTPFWIEGWALYWEMLLWDLDFARSAEDRVGMLFWRRHRCARIVFSLSYHSGKMSPRECVDYLVERVGHEQSAAAAEVRRSIMGGYSPLYQAAYMLGGLQLRDMHRELVQGGKMSNRQFHDAILREHSIPIELLRAYMTEQELSADTLPSWKFGGEADADANTKSNVDK